MASATLLPVPLLLPLLLFICNGFFFSSRVSSVGTATADKASPSSESDNGSLEFTPTWIVAGVCTVIIAISLCAERFLHYLGKFLKYKQQDAILGALEKLKEELMLLGFISLLLTVFQGPVSRICIREDVTHQMLPCTKRGSNPVEVRHHEGFFIGHTWKTRRLLSGSDGSNICKSQGKVSLLSLEALHHLHIFIFVLAVVHVAFCATTMVLGGAKIRRWKSWEEAIPKENSHLSRAEHIHRHHHHEFVSARAKGYWRKSIVVSWIMSFFKQFHASVTKSDYRALRAGFIMVHCGTNPNFDFHKYVMRALEDDFKKVVGISWYLWLFVVFFLLLDVHGWHTYFWLSFLPLILLLAVGTKLECIITSLAKEIAEMSVHDQSGRVKPSDNHFWFRRPGILLYLIHFILFQNAFEMAFFFWILSTYGFNSCIMERVGYVIPRLVMGVIIQVMCSYSTLPLYAIVTQMGDSYKQAIFAQHMQTTIHGWAASARKRKRSGKPGVSSFFGMFGRGEKKQNTDTGASTGVQMQGMTVEYSGSSNNAHRPDILERIVAVSDEITQNHDVQEVDQRSCRSPTSASVV